MSDVINYLTEVRFGLGAVRELSDALATLGVERPFVVSDRGLSDSGILAAALSEGGVGANTVFVETPENPTEAAVEAALDALRAADCDGIVAIGGGSSIDLAKGVALLATHPPPLEQYAAIRGGVARIGTVLSLVAVPTTAGTGSEVGRGALITLGGGRKLGFLSSHLIPKVAICDPNLTRSLPPRLTAATGMDAISHCVETFLSPRFNPPADAIALDGLARAWRAIGAAVADGSDMAARSQMMMAALEGAMAFQKGLGAVHSTSHALGGMGGTGLHHGTLNAVMMPAVLAFNAQAVPEKMARLAHAMDLPPSADVPQAFATLASDLGLPTTLSQMGVSEDVLPEAARWSAEDHSTATNPRPVSVGDFEGLLRAAFA